MIAQRASWFAPIFISITVNLAFLWVIQVLTYISAPDKTADLSPIQIIPMDTTPAPEIVKLAPDPVEPPPSAPAARLVSKSAPAPIPAKPEQSSPPAPAQTAPQVKDLGLDEARQDELVDKSERPSSGPSQVSAQPGFGDGSAQLTSDVASSGIGDPFVPISRLTKIPAFAFRMEPVYPERSRIKGKESSVIAEIDLDNKGSIIEIRIIKSGGKDFDQSVRIAILASAFTPGYINDRAVPVRVQIPYVFKLR
jgi:TonB family protein